MSYGLMPRGTTGCVYCRESGFYPSDMELCDVYCLCPIGKSLEAEEKGRILAEKARKVAERMATPESRARREESARQSRRRAAEIVKSGEVDEAFLRRRVTI